MPVSVEHCVVCQGSHFRRVEPYQSERIKTFYTACVSCGLVVMNPLPTPEEINSFYASEYWRQKAELNPAAAMQKQREFAVYIQNFIERHGSLALPHIHTLLEIGSSFGVTLQHLAGFMKSQGQQIEVFAIEPSSYAVQHGRDSYQGVTMLGEDIEELRRYTDKTFDLIILSHVLEHLYNPVEALSLIASHMSVNSLLYIEVPNYYGHYSLEYGHHYCFTPASLRNCLMIAGFDIVAFDGLHHNPDVSLYLTCLVRKKPSADVALSIQRESVAEVVRQRRQGRRAYNWYLLRHTLASGGAKGVVSLSRSQVDHGDGRLTSERVP
ncbi:MAG: class I SAM-dependent methyltransferase [Oscillochloris sp.]|nr:class I SAM-dependent methyltransferase [Oscillochloris sp.]